MKAFRKLLGLLAASSALVLTGCSNAPMQAEETNQTPSSSPSIDPPSAAPIVTHTPSPTPSSSTNARGNLPMEDGSFGVISSRSTGNVHVKFQVKSIKRITCPPKPYSVDKQGPENGQLIALDMVIETTPELVESSFPKFTLSGYDFKYIAPSGTTFNGNLQTFAAFSCLPAADTFPSGGMGPAEKVVAKVVLDVPAPHGILVLRTGALDAGGFEYSF